MTPESGDRVADAEGYCRNCGYTVLNEGPCARCGYDGEEHPHREQFGDP